ncbi:kinase-like protein [Aspergillus indologenus CBS 114.80]|uniref:Kinase-like protein n=1 Tax=Aspergillus indologenus CBS 114.80 TaxID=1450541 RepID=A0A2V5HZE0_9EURO|nr:kinase-like protein [Aspergillus indologenus CBS 114.80]
MTDPSGGIPFRTQNMRKGDRYIKIGNTLFPCPEFENITDFITDLPPDQELITVLDKQMGRIILEYDFSYVTKSGHGVRPAEAEAMRLVSKHTSVPVPEVFFTEFGHGYGSIYMTRIPGSPLEEKWDTLDEKSKESVCLQVWGLISKIRTIPRPSELQGLFQCAADGSLSRDPLLEDLRDPGRPLMNDSDLRTRIFERYYACGGRRFEHQLPDMLPRSDCTVFTHADIAPRNIMVDERNTVTGILDWEYAGWYPDYWEYAQILRPAAAFGGDWSVWMDRTAPQRWDISGITAARRVLF